MKRIFFVILICILFSGRSVYCGSFTSAFQKEREKYSTKLKYKAESPQSYKEIKPPEGVKEVYYNSGGLKLKGWLHNKSINKKHPAVVFLHGGFAFGSEDWRDASPFAANGFILFMPMLRAENGNPGNFEMFYGELDDALAAGNYVKSLPNVDKENIYLIGHSVGGSLTILLSLMDTPYKAAVAMSGNPELNRFIMAYEKYAPFDTKNKKEMILRNPSLFYKDVRIPLYLFAEENNPYIQNLNKNFSKKVNSVKEISLFAVMKGDHMSMVAPSVETAVKIFLHYTKK